MKHIHSNYRCRCGEIDPVMKDEEQIVFVEVRYRGGQRYGGALASVGPRKISRLRRSASHYLQRFDPAGKQPCRFDVVIPDSESDPGGGTWIKNAF